MKEKFFFEKNIHLIYFNFQFLNFDSMKDKIDSLTETEVRDTDVEKETIVLNKKVNKDYT